MTPFGRVAVLGAGTMGARIAAHLANAGVPVDLLDLAAPNGPDRNVAAFAGIEAAAKQRPVGFYTDSARSLIDPGNFEDDLERVAACEWIIEAVAENLEIKRRLWSRVAAVRAPGTIVSTNTSGIPLARISEGFSEEFRAHFLGTHFFNPPRYLHLVEMIPGAATRPKVLARVAKFCDIALGKGVVLCKDTPNFIANRIGSFFGATVHALTAEGGYTVEEVDALTGPLIGLPRSASFRLVDIIGLDVWAHVLRNLYDLAPHDPARERYRVPEFMERMIGRGWLGEKSGQGFYKRVGKQKEIHALDLCTMEYRPAGGLELESVDAAKRITDLPARLRTLTAGDDRAGRFLWPLFRDYLIYSAEMVPEISDRIVEIDRAMRWGYNFTHGPFELWDALGVAETVERMERDRCSIPVNIQRMLGSGARRFYETGDRSGTRYFDLRGAAYARLEPRPGVLVLGESKRALGLMCWNAGASLVNLGEGVLCVAIQQMGEDALAMTAEALDVAEQEFRAVVIASENENFSPGPDLGWILWAARERRWSDLDAALRRAQELNLAVKYCGRPVVAATSGRTLGPGCELALHAARVQASAETYMGLTEAAVGLIPAGGGCKEMLLRLGNAKAACELIAAAKMSGSAPQAREMGLLRACDGVTMNPERLLADAKAAALALAPGYQPPAPPEEIAVVADDLPMTSAARVFARGGTEQAMLDREREVFLRLCGDAATQARIEAALGGTR